MLSLYFEEYEYLFFRVIQSSVASNGTPERDTLSEAAVSLRTMVMFVTWSSSGTEFLGKELFYDSDDIFVTSFLRDWDGERKLSRCLPNTSTFVPK